MTGEFKFWDKYMDLEQEELKLFNFILQFDFGDGNREYFYSQLDKEFPGLSDCYRKRFGNAYEILSPNHKQLYAMIEKTCTKYNILYKPQDCFDYLNRFEDKKNVQFELF